MPRRARVVIPHTAHHVTQRGNYKQNVFERDIDFRRYLYWMRLEAQQYNLKIHAYCLMRNHIHFIVTPADRKGLANVFKNVHMRYSAYKNTQKNKLGHLWQGRFFSCVLSRSHLLRAIRYVEMNPVRAKIVKYPWDYIWSSTQQHMNKEKFPIIKTEFPKECLKEGLHSSIWKNYLLEDDFEITEEIRNKTKTGLAIGSEKFINKLETKFGVQLKKMKAGRPKQQKSEIGVCP